MHYEYKGWWLAVLIALDQLGNAVGGGNPDITISARVGHFAAKTPREEKPIKYRYWKGLEKIIDFAFLPVDGKNHCYNAWQADHEHKRYERGNDFTQAVLSVITGTACLLIAGVLRMLLPVYRFFKNK